MDTVVRCEARKFQRDSNMPIFEYVCGECRHSFEAVVQGSQKAVCPKCGSRKLKQQVSNFGVGGKTDSFSIGSFGKAHAGSPMARAIAGRKRG